MTTELTDILPEGVYSRTVDQDGITHYRDFDGQHHNPDGPAIITPDKATFWFLTGRDPNERPDSWFGNRGWQIHGTAHRIDGPAIERADGTGTYWVDGICLTEEEFRERFPDYLGSVSLKAPTVDPQAHSYTLTADGIIQFQDSHGRLHNPHGPAFIALDNAAYKSLTGKDLTSRYPHEAQENPGGHRVWLIHGHRHRTDGPAVERDNGPAEYWVNGIRLTEQEYRCKFPNYEETAPSLNYMSATYTTVSGEALTYSFSPHNGISFYDSQGLPHNPDGPATVFLDDAAYIALTGKSRWERDEVLIRSWYIHGNHHRTDGPAIERSDGTVAYFVQGKQLTEEEFHQHYPAA